MGRFIAEQMQLVAGDGAVKPLYETYIKKKTEKALFAFYVGHTTKCLHLNGRIVCMQSS